MRQEFLDERGQTITIVRPDLKLVYVILPLQRIYMEIPLTQSSPASSSRFPPGLWASTGWGKSG